jgi:orotidine-5'-phosphate decarboxylase
MSFIQKLKSQIEKTNSLVSIGLDSDTSKLPHAVEGSQFEFNKQIIDETYKYVCSYKINTAFYEGHGVEGIQSLKETTDYLVQNYPLIPIILDAKRGDIDNTNLGYIDYAFKYLNVDAITLHPYMGEESIRPFLDLKNKGIILLCRTSNQGSDEFQNLILTNENSKIPLYEYVANKIINEWNKNDNCLLVVGATHVDELKRVREIDDSIFFLVPGIGFQGGDLEGTLKYGLNRDKSGLIINSSRSIIFASSDIDFAKVAGEKTIELRDSINKFRY